MVFGCARLVTHLTRYARMAFVKSVYVLPQMRIAPVEFVAEVAVEYLVRASTMSAEFLEGHEHRLI